MNSIQRVQAAINHQPVDRIPKGELLVEKGFIVDFMDMVGKSASTMLSRECLEMEIECYHLMGLDLVCLQGEVEPHTINRFIKEGFFVFLLLDGVLQTTMHKMGFMQFMRSVAGQPEQVGREMQRLSRLLVALIKESVQQGAHGIIIADDIAYKKSTYVSPVFIRKFLLPCWREQVDAAKEMKTPVFFHSDGNINAVLSDIVEAGFDGLQSLEPSAGMEIKEIKEKYGQDLCLMGNIDPRLLSRDGGSDALPGSAGFHELARAVQELIVVAAPSSGFIFGTCSGLHAGLSPQKVNFMYSMLKNDIINNDPVLKLF